MKFVAFFLFSILLSVAHASIVDNGPPQDALGHWEFDLYDALGNQRGTTANPLYFYTTGLSTSALQTTGNTALSAIQTNTANTASYLSNLGTLATTTLQSTGNNYLAQIATNTASALTDNTMIGTIAALNGTTVLPAQGVYTVSVVLSGTFVGTVVFEGQLADTNGTWVQVPAFIQTTTLPYQPTFSTTTAGTYLITGGGYINIRARASAYTSGTINVGMDGSLAQQTTFSAQLGPWNVGRTWTLQSGTDNIGVVPIDGQKATYSASIVGVAIASSNTTDVFAIAGSASKIIRITRIGFSGAQTGTGQRDVALIRRSTINTGGTSVAVANVSLDTTNAAATASVVYYTANPTLGTSAGMIRSARLLFGASGINSDNYSWDFGTRPAQAVVLRGANQQLVINLNGVSSGGTVVAINVEWTEE